MKHYLLILSLIYTVSHTYGQDDSANGILDGVYISDSMYTYDTLVNFYADVDLNWIDTTGGSSNYEFKEGKSSYFEITIRRICDCHDGSTTQIMIVQLDDLDTSNILKLNTVNTSWLVRGVWKYDPFVEFSTGTLDFNRNSLEFDSRMDLARNIWWPDVVIQTKLIALKED